MKDPAVIAFCRAAIFNRLETAMSPISAIEKKRHEKARQAAQAEDDEKTRQRVRGYLSGDRQELIDALEQIGYRMHQADKLGLLAAALIDGDLLTIGNLVAKAIFLELTEVAENE